MSSAKIDFRGASQGLTNGTSNERVEHAESENKTLNVLYLHIIYIIYILYLQ